MDNYVVPATLVLFVTNVSFAILANHWRRKAKGNDHATMKLLLETSSAHREGYAEGYDAGRKMGTGGMYRSAMMAGATDDVLAALRATGRRLLNEPSAFEESAALTALPSHAGSASGAD